jgi:putative endonuclease
MRKNSYVYILECCDKTLYTGSTNNIEKRILEHNSSRYGAKYTRTRRPVRLVYVEICSTHSLALKREAEIKRLSRAKKLMLIASSTDDTREA